MVEIKIFDPPMCCSSGVCGPSVDPALVAMNELIARIQRDYTGKATVSRHMLGKDIVAFAGNIKIVDLINSEGTGVLPLVTVDGEIIKTGGYPAFEDLQPYLEK